MPTIELWSQQRHSVVLALFLVVLDCPTVMANDHQPAGESFYQRLTRTVIRLELMHGSADERKPIGTGFFVVYKHALYLVTARHLTDAGQTMYARIPAKQQDLQEREVLELSLPHQAWVAHPSEPSKLPEAARPGFPPPVVRPVDVAVTRVPRPLVHQLALAPVRIFAASDPEPPERVWVFGYPLDLGFKLSEQRPLGRFGRVAMVANAPYIWYRTDRKYTNGSYADGRAMALDLRLFAGNSGSPVLRATGTDEELVLLGLVIGGDKRLDIAIAEPVSRIRETLELAHTQTAPVQPRWLPAVVGKK